MKTIIMRDVGNAVEILYNLDISLSNHFVGQPDHPNDRGVDGVRKVIRHAMDTLTTRVLVENLQSLLLFGRL